MGGSAPHGDNHAHQATIPPRSGNHVFSAAATPSSGHFRGLPAAALTELSPLGTAPPRKKPRPREGGFDWVCEQRKGWVLRGAEGRSYLCVAPPLRRKPCGSTKAVSPAAAQLGPRSLPDHAHSKLAPNSAPSSLPLPFIHHQLYLVAGRLGCELERSRPAVISGEDHNPPGASLVQCRP